MECAHQHVHRHGRWVVFVLSLFSKFLTQSRAGYQTCLLSNFYAFPEFNKKFGEQLDDGTYQVPAPWQAGLSNGVYVGEIIGLMINGWASEKFGYRKTVIGSLVLLTGFIAIFFTAQSVVALQVGEILAGIPWGVFQTLTVTYASEVVPVSLRGYLTTYVNFCWGLGESSTCSGCNNIY